ncbi:hypothetical protein AGMMS50262_02700 [Bacteroidia bacterium]|nr:hypothetical protein AGMMS50262_02700 [Bacteroidia bacterium]
MKITREQVIGYSSSSVICLLLLLLLSLITLHTHLSAGNGFGEGEGVLVNYGTVNWAKGTFEPRPEGDVRDVSIENAAAPTIPKENPIAITQTGEPTIAVKTPEKKPTEKDQSAEQKAAIDKQMSGLFGGKGNASEGSKNTFGTGTSTSGSEGTAASGTGNQGSREGNAATGSYSGVGTFNLEGRSLAGGGLQRPEYTIQEEGSIVVEITVNPQGNVIHAEVRLKGTNIEDAMMRRSAVEAARKTRFNSINESQNKIGTITYRYSLK